MLNSVGSKSETFGNNDTETYGPSLIGSVAPSEGKANK